MVSLVLRHWRSSCRLFVFSTLMSLVYHGVAGRKVMVQHFVLACWSRIDIRVSSYKFERSSTLLIWAKLFSSEFLMSLTNFTLSIFDILR